MKKLLALAMSLCLLLAAVAFPAGAEEEKVINLFSFAGYIDDQTLNDFEAATGIKVNFSYFTTNEEMMAKLQANGGSDYDLVLASDYALNTLRTGGLLQKLDKTLLPNYVNLKPSYLGKYFDPDNEYVIPYAAGTPLIVYDPALVTIDIKGYADLWDESLKDNVVLIDDARNIVGITLKTMGKSFNETDPAVLEQAKEKLMPLYPNVRAFDYETPYTALVNGEAAVAYMFTPYVLIALDARPDLKVVYPEEGLGFGIDGLVIPVNAPHPTSAHALLDYLMDGKVAAHTVEMQYYMSPNAQADQYLPDSLKNNPAFVTDEQVESAEFIMNVGDAEQLFQQIWTEFKQQ